LLAQIADDADNWNEALDYYRQVIQITKPGVLQSIYDLNAEPVADLRTIKANMNSFDTVFRADKSLDARTGIAIILARRGNYREADQEYQAVLKDATMLYAFGAPDESELTPWLRSLGDTEIKSADVAAHRRQTGLVPDSNEQQRFEFASLAIASHRAVITSYRASLYENENDLENAKKTYERANALNTNLVGGSFSFSGTYVTRANRTRTRKLRSRRGADRGRTCRSHSQERSLGHCQHAGVQKCVAPRPGSHRGIKAIGGGRSANCASFRFAFPGCGNTAYARTN